jgi:uncharacterized peroxidase-related enzyme
MSNLPILTLEDAPQAVRGALEAVRAKYGFLPNLIAGLANAPAAMEGYLTLAGIFAKSSLTPAEQQIVALSVSVENVCQYCVSAHSLLASAVLDQASIRALRESTPLPDPKHEALARFTRAIVAKRGWAQEELVAFEQAGYQRQQALEVVLGVSFKTLSNYANHLLDTPVDLAFDSTRWCAPAHQAA